MCTISKLCCTNWTLYVYFKIVQSFRNQHSLFTFHKFTYCAQHKYHVSCVYWWSFTFIGDCTQRRMIAWMTVGALKGVHCATGWYSKRRITWTRIKGGRSATVQPRFLSILSLMNFYLDIPVYNNSCTHHRRVHPKEEHRWKECE